MGSSIVGSIVGVVDFGFVDFGVLGSFSDWLLKYLLSRPSSLAPPTIFQPHYKFENHHYYCLEDETRYPLTQNLFPSRTHDPNNSPQGSDENRVS